MLHHELISTLTERINELTVEINKLKNKPATTLIELADKQLLNNAAFEGIDVEEQIVALIKIGANVKAKDVDGRNALHLALLADKKSMANFLLRGKEYSFKGEPALFTLRDNTGLTAIQLMAQLGKWEAVEWLYDVRRTLTVPDLVDNNESFDEIYQVATPEIKQLLANKRLFNFSKTGPVESVQHALICGADINIKQSNGWTALYQAIYSERLDLVEILLENGADPALYNNKIGTVIDSKFHDSAFHLALRAKDNKIKSAVATAFLIKVASLAPKEAYSLAPLTDEILKEGISVEEPKLYVKANEHGLLYFAYRMIIPAFISSNELMKISNEMENCQPLSMKEIMLYKDRILKIAMQRNHIPKHDIIAALEADANLIGVDPKDGQTALHKAVAAGQLFNINLLLKAHAEATGEKHNIYIKDKSGKTPYDIAVQMNKLIDLNGPKPMSAAMAEIMGKYDFKQQQKLKQKEKLPRPSLTTVNFLATVTQGLQNNNEQNRLKENTEVSAQSAFNNNNG